PALPPPDRAARLPERKRAAARALERRPEPGGGKVRHKKNQIRAGPKQRQPHAGPAQGADHEPCDRSSSRAFTVPGFACRSSVALSARRPPCCCSSASHAVSAENEAPSSCTRTLPAPSASTRFSCPRSPCLSAACSTAAAGLAGGATLGAPRTLATSAACSWTCASCACTEAQRPGKGLGVGCRRREAEAQGAVGVFDALHAHARFALDRGRRTREEREHVAGRGDAAARAQVLEAAPHLLGRIEDRAGLGEAL